MTRRSSKLIKIEKHQGFFTSPETGIIYWRGYINKLQYKISCGTTKITEAKRYVDNFKIENSSVDTKKEKRKRRGNKNPAIEDIWDELIEERAVTNGQNTLDTYKYSWKKKIGVFWGEKNLADMNEKTVLEFEQWFLKEFPNERFFQIRKHFTMLINFMVKKTYLTKKIEVRKLDKVIESRSKHQTPFRVYSDSEINLLIEGAVSERARVCLILYANTGMRKMELLSREWKDVDWASKSLNVWSSKNKKWREVPLLKPCIDALKEWKKISVPKSKFIFPKATDPENHIIGQYFDKDWIATKKFVGLKNQARVHDIRHTFATKTAQDNWSPAVACEVLDMSLNEYMRTYVHINAKDIRKLMAKSFGKSR